MWPSPRPSEGSARRRCRTTGWTNWRIRDHNYDDRGRCRRRIAGALPDTAPQPARPRRLAVAGSAAKTGRRLMTRTLATVSAVLLAAALCAGCAAHRSGDSSQRFVKRGEPAVDSHEPARPAPDSLEQYVAKIRKLASRARPAPN